MADRMAAEIWIGGKFPRSLLDEFPISDLRLDWDETPFDATSEEGIFGTRDDDGLLHFADCEAAWGLEISDVMMTERTGSATYRRGKGNKVRSVPLRL